MGTIRKGILVLDPRTKILLLLGINIFVFTNSHVYAEMLVVAALVILLLLCGVYKTALKSTITYIVLLAIKCWILPFCPEIIMTSLNIVVITFRKLLPCVTLGALLVQTTPIWNSKALAVFILKMTGALALRNKKISSIL